MDARRTDCACLNDSGCTASMNCTACLFSDLVICEACGAMVPLAMSEEDTSGNTLCADCTAAHVIECADCGDWAPRSARMPEYCVECAENFVTCEHCLEAVRIDDSSSYDSDYYCEDCFNELFYSCERCGEPEPIDDVVRVRNAHGMENWCERCTDNNTFHCDSCGGNFTEHFHGISNNYVTYCEDCSEDYRVCDICDAVCNFDDIDFDDESDRYICNECASEHRAKSPIKEYRYKQSIVLHGDSAARMGVEIEVDKLNDAMGTAQDILTEFSNNEDLFCLKYDGSLSDRASSFELVTQPCDLQYHKENFPWSALCARIIEQGGRSHNTTTCGLHVHISKHAFGMIAWERVCRFVYHNVSRMEKLARRSNSTWAQNLPDNYLDIISYRDKTKRYLWLNFTNQHTVEFRGFKGTLNHCTVKACIEMVHAICNYCDNWSGHDWEDFKVYCMENKSLYGNLINFYSWEV